MSVHDEHARTAAAPAEEDTRDGSQLSEATSTQPGSTALPAEELGQARTAGLVLPRPSVPGTAWSPSTGAEQHLLREGYRLDRIRQQLLTEVGRLRHLYASRSARLGARGEQTSPCPLTGSELRVLVAAAAGESPRETADRALITESTIRQQRKAASRRLGAKSIPHAVAVAVAAGWITAENIIEGTTP